MGKPPQLDEEMGAPSGSEGAFVVKALGHQGVLAGALWITGQ